jgi:hypothetical protein
MRRRLFKRVNRLRIIRCLRRKQLIPYYWSMISRRRRIRCNRLKSVTANEVSTAEEVFRMHVLDPTCWDHYVTVSNTAFTGYQEASVSNCNVVDKTFLLWSSLRVYVRSRAASMCVCSSKSKRKKKSYFLSISSGPLL